MTPEQIASEAISWLGTPFRDGGRIRGRKGGVDCAQFLCCVYEQCGAGKIETPRYNLQYMQNCGNEMYVKQVLEYCDEITESEAKCGDVCLLHWGHVYSHSLILLEPWPGKAIHALNPFGVVFTDASKDARILATIRRYRNFPPRFFRVKG